jgi:hypothetical protein
MMGLFVGLKRGGLTTAASIIVSALVLLAAGALAAEETVYLGDYEVSFDLGNYTGYELSFEEVPYAVVDGEEYPSHICWIQGEEKMMMIAITDYGVPMEATSSLTRRAVVSYLNDADPRPRQSSKRRRPRMRRILAGHPRRQRDPIWPGRLHHRLRGLGGADGDAPKLDRCQGSGGGAGDGSEVGVGQDRAVRDS